MTYWFWLASLASLAKPVSRYALNFILNHYQVGAGKLKWSSEISLSWLVFENPWTLDSGLWEVGTSLKEPSSTSRLIWWFVWWRLKDRSVISNHYWSLTVLRVATQGSGTVSTVSYLLYLMSRLQQQQNCSQFKSITIHKPTNPALLCSLFPW